MRLGAVGDIIAEGAASVSPFGERRSEAAAWKAARPAASAASAAGSIRSSTASSSRPRRARYSSRRARPRRLSLSSTSRRLVGLGARWTSPIASIRSQSLLTDGAREPRASPSARRFVPSCFSITSRARSCDGDTVPDAADSWPRPQSTSSSSEAATASAAA